jgi:lipoprotein signal peptidase
MNGCRAGWAVCGFTALGVILDLSVKALAREWLTPHNPVALMPGLNLNLGYNTGVAFGLFANEAALTLTVMILAQLGLIAVLIVMLFRSTGVARYCYAAIVSGALGNLADRLTSGAVTDYIDVYAGTWHWPTFNLADILISLGIAGLISHELFFDRSRTAVQE